MDWKYICPKCGRTKDEIGMTFIKTEIITTKFILTRDGKIEPTTATFADIVDSKFKTYFCMACGRELKKSEAIRSAKEWFENLPIKKKAELFAEELKSYHGFLEE